MHNRNMRILVLAPHADDETLGMGGTIALKRNQGYEVFVAILTGHGEKKHPLWSQESWIEVRSEAKKAAEILNVSELIFRELPAACLDYIPSWQTNEEINKLIQEIKPEELYIPFYYDLHKDHHAISYAAKVAARPYLDSSKFIKRIIAYETLSETHLNYSNISESFQPNLFVNISEYIDKKLEAMKQYKSQLQPETKPRSLESIEALARLRGSHIGCYAAEAFLLLGEYIR